MFGADIKSFIRNKAVNNGLWLYFLQFFNTIFPLITIPYITRILGAEKYGVFSGVLNLTTYLQAIIEFGFSLSATRRISAIKEKEGLNKLFSCVFWSRIVLYGVVWLFAICYIFISNDSYDAKRALFILCVSLFAYCIQQNWLFLGKQDMKAVSITSIISRIISTTLIFILVKSSDDLLVYCALYSVSPVLSNVLGLFIAIKKYNLKMIAVPITELFFFVRSSVYVFLTQFGSVVFSSVGITCLKAFTNDYIVGIYSAIYKIPYIVLLIWGPVSQALFPVSCKYFNENKVAGIEFVRKIKKYILAFFVVIIIIIAVMARQIVNVVIGQEYTDYVFIVYPLLLWVLIGIVNNFYGVQTLIAAGYEKDYGKCFQYGIYATILLSVLLTYIWGLYGAAIAPAVAEIILHVAFRIRIRHVLK